MLAGWALLAGALYGEVSRDIFVAAGRGRHSPAIEVDFADIPSENAHLDQKMAALKSAGFGTLVLVSVTGGSNAWERLVPVAESCRRHHLRLDCDFFPQDPQTPQLGLLQYSVRTLDFDHPLPADCTNAPAMPVARIFKPLAVSNRVAVTRAIVEGQQPLPQTGRWTEYSFSVLPLTPAAVNYLDPSVFVPSINQFLINAQRRLGNNYGTVFNSLNLPSADRPERVWSANLPLWFRLNLSFDYLRALPWVTGAEPYDAAASGLNSALRFRRGLEKLWREHLCVYAHSLVPAAGLDCGMLAESLPLPPEEVGMHFQVPILTGSTCSVHRAFNRRVCGGSRLFERQRIVGRVAPRDETAAACMDALYADGATLILLTRSAGDQSADYSDEPLKGMLESATRCSYVLLNTEPAPGILCCAAELPPAADAIFFDRLSSGMLSQADIAEGRVGFPGARGGDTLLIDDADLREIEGLEDRLNGAGVRLVSLDAIDTLNADFTWESDDGPFQFSFVRRCSPAADYFLIRNESDTEGMAELSFRTEFAGSVSRWQPRSGRIFEISNFSQAAPGIVSLTTPVRPNELFFMVFE